MNNIIVQFSNITKNYHSLNIIENLSFSVYKGEFLTILGPSGCGKTTILRLIAGFEQPDKGKITINGKNIIDIPANKRKVNTVFQNYALFPHMNVYENISFGLKMENKSTHYINEQLKQILKIMRLEDLIYRMPTQLSGGEQQRVAIARAIIKKPHVLLLDESLNALDYTLRKEMQFELKQIHETLGITFIFVTHDQEEALSMSDRVVVMSKGKIQQVGTPRDVYESPKNLFVAKFVGEINIFDGIVEEVQEGSLLVKVEKEVNYFIKEKTTFKKGEKIKILLRPEDLRIETTSDITDKKNKLKGVVKTTTYKGATLDSVIKLNNGKKIKASEFFDEDDEDFEYKNGETVFINWVEGWEVLLPDD